MLKGALIFAVGTVTGLAVGVATGLVTGFALADSLNKVSIANAPKKRAGV